MGAPYWPQVAPHEPRLHRKQKMKRRKLKDKALEVLVAEAQLVLRRPCRQKATRMMEGASFETKVPKSMMMQLKPLGQGYTL